MVDVRGCPFFGTDDVCFHTKERALGSTCHPPMQHLLSKYIDKLVIQSQYLQYRSCCQQARYSITIRQDASKLNTLLHKTVCPQARFLLPQDCMTGVSSPPPNQSEHLEMPHCWTFLLQRCCEARHSTVSSPALANPGGAQYRPTNLLALVGWVRVSQECYNCRGMEPRTQVQHLDIDISYPVGWFWISELLLLQLWHILRSLVP